MDVSVTIVNWNATSALEACLRSVFATRPGVEYEVIVIDNGSDDSIDALMGEFAHAVWVRNSTNIGFGKAQNQAIRLARGRYVLLLNNDAMVEPDTIPTLARFMDQHPEVGSCGCPDHRQVSLGTAYSGAFRDYPSLHRITIENLWAVVRPPHSWDLRRLAGAVYRWMGEALPQAHHVEVAWIVGALLCVRKEAFDEIGGFDERFFLFDEDIDLCRRMRDAGWKVAFTNSTKFTHFGGASSSVRRDIERIRGDSRALYFRKYHGRAAELVFRLQHYALRQCLLTLRRPRRPG